MCLTDFFRLVTGFSWSTFSTISGGSRNPIFFGQKVSTNDAILYDLDDYLIILWQCICSALLLGHSSEFIGRGFCLMSTCTSFSFRNQVGDSASEPETGDRYIIFSGCCAYCRIEVVLSQSSWYSVARQVNSWLLRSGSFQDGLGGFCLFIWSGFTQSMS